MSIVEPDEALVQGRHRLQQLVRPQIPDFAVDNHFQRVRVEISRNAGVELVKLVYRVRLPRVPQNSII